jgi:hypothetical protein
MGVIAIRPRCKVYVAGRRLHHGLTGCILIALGAALVAHDRADVPWLPRRYPG